MNLISALSKAPHNVYCQSSLTNIDNDKYDLILTNPPFGLSLKFETISQNYINNINNKNNIDDIYKIKDNKSIVQFMELVLYKLKDNGICIVIMPYGEFFSGSSKSSVKVRKHFMDNLNITDIINFPGGVFSHTHVETSAIIFNKSGKTEKINFLKSNVECTILTNITTVDAKDMLLEPKCSWFVNDYLKDKSNNEDTVKWIEFGEMFTLEKGEIQSSKVEEDVNGITFINMSKYDNKYIKPINNTIIDGNNVFICTNGNGQSFPVKYYSGKCIHSNLMSLLIIKDTYKNKINIKYIYYYLLEKQLFVIDNYLKGTANKSLDIDNFNRMNISIPSLEEQNKLVEQLDILLNNDINNKQIENLKLMNKIKLESVITKNKYESKILGEVFKEVKIGKDVVSTDRKKGEYPFYGANGIIDYVDSYIFDGKYLLTARTGSLGSLHISNGKFWCSGDVHRMEFENDSLLSYTYYYLQTIDFQKFRTGSAHPKLSSSSLKSIKIPIPSLEEQKEIVDYCDRNNNLIKIIEDIMSENKKIASDLLKF